MRKLVESTFVTLSGDVSSPHVWGPPFEDAEHADYAHKLLFAADALLLGRVTYQGFSASYPNMTAHIGVAQEFVKRMNSLPKYVVSTTLQKTVWNATLIKGNVAAKIAELKQQPGRNILKYGTGPLDRLLMEHGLVDEYHFWIYPVVVGSSQQLFEDIHIPARLKLVETTKFSSGVIVLTYMPGS